MKSYLNILYGSEMFDLYTPDVMPAPLLILFHGGGLKSGDKSDYRDAHVVDNLVKKGIAVACANYRMYPNAKFPDYICDCAECCSYIFSHANQWGNFTEKYIGGDSAGAYISMMLCFDPTYLNEYGLDPDKIDGYFFNAGQTTTHFSVLEEYNIDSRAVRVDRAAPLFFIDHAINNPLKKPRMLFLVAENDMPCRYEQHTVMLRTMWSMGYSPVRVQFVIMYASTHCSYNKRPIYTDILSSFILHD